MSYRYVLDTEPLLAYYYGEPGGETVRDLLMDVYMGEESVAVSEITATELMYKIARFETGSPIRNTNRRDTGDRPTGRA